MHALRRWTTSLASIALILAATFFAVTARFPGDSYLDRLEEAYIVLWTNTTQTQFTSFSRRK